MKEIKIRVWDKKKKKMSKAFDILDAAYEGFSRPITDDNGEFDRRADYEVMQFTGLIDWKGAPIFEGDKVMATYKENGEEVSSPGIVEWYDREAMFSVKLGDPDGASETWGIIKFSVLEVFGHIYDGGATASA